MGLFFGIFLRIIFYSMQHRWPDKIAAAGYYVVVPDFLLGDPFTSENANRPLPVWLKDHQPNEAFEDAKPVIEALKYKGVLSIGAASFCWGAKTVAELAKSKLIQAVVLLHPSFITLDDIKGVSIPIAILGAEIDQYCPPELLKQFQQLLTAELGTDIFRGELSNSPVMDPKPGTNQSLIYKPMEKFVS